jgi:glycosyltransferase involved in cell wall biosynthesis
MSSTPRIVLFAYACAPGWGSEEGTGWGFARVAASFGETWVLVRDLAAQVDALKAGVATAPERLQLHIVPVPTPRWASWLERVPFLPGRSYVPYLAWQAAALRTARALHERQRFSLAWHVTWSTGWFGTLACLLDVPFVFGPIAAGVGSPWRLLPSLRPKAIAREVLRSTVRTAARYFNPLARLSWQRARVILAANPETVRWLPRRQRKKSVIVVPPILDELPPIRTRADVHEPPLALFAGRMEVWKGAHLAIMTMALLPEWHLRFCGVGGDEEYLRNLAHRLGVFERIEFKGYVPRAELLRMMREDADVLLFPSLHDEGGWVVSEAVASGLPVVCLDRGGPPVLGGVPVPAGSTGPTVRDLARACRSVAGVLAEGPVPDMQTQRVRVGAILRERGLLDPDIVEPVSEP